MHKEGLHSKIRNFYPVLNAKSSTLAQKNMNPTQRHWNLSKDGFLGIQHYSHSFISVTEPSWEQMRESLYKILSLSLAGFPVCGIDLEQRLIPYRKTLFGSKQSKNHMSNSLYERSIQLSMFLPLVCSGLPTQNKTLFKSLRNRMFGIYRKQESIFKKSLYTRYKLLPYLYTLFYLNSKFGSPIVRPIFYDFPDVEISQSMDSFMLGSQILVVPVLFSHENKKMQKRVFLPKGNWYNYNNGKKMIGDKYHTISLSRNSIPIFLKSGTFLPTCKASLRYNAQENYENSLVWEYYPDVSGNRASGEVYLDDTTSIGYQKDHYTRILLKTTNKTKDSVTLNIYFPKKNYVPKYKFMELCLPSKYKIMRYNSREIKASFKTLREEDRNSSFSIFKVPLSSGSYTFLSYIKTEV